MNIKEHVLCRNPLCNVTFLPDGSRKVFCCRSCSAQVNNKNKIRRNGWNEENKQKAREITQARWATKPPREVIKQKCAHPECDNLFPKARRKNFCSVTCRVRSRMFNPQYLLKDLDGIREAKAIIRRDQMMLVSFDTLGNHLRRLRVIAEQNASCINCGLSEWLGTPITFEIEHKDGNRENHIRDNLEARCPNCHSQTDTWRGRNNKNKKISDEQLIEAIRSTRSICQALMSLNMAPKGGNYKRAKRLKVLSQPKVVGTENSAISTPQLKAGCSPSELSA